MKRSEIISRVRNLTRDLSNSIFREVDIIDYINEGVDRCVQVIPELSGMVHLTDNNDVPILLPTHYHHLLSVYTASRCFGQDERHYQATTFMNEFEQKLDELKMAIESGSVVIKNPDGSVVTRDLNSEYVKDVYFAPYYGDDDPGVEGV